jgi:hypothetical protein
LVQIFVFTDCVIIAGTTKSRHNGSEEWTLLENVGIGKVIDVTELSGESNSTVLSYLLSLVCTQSILTDTSPLLELDLLPVDIKNLGESAVSESVSLEVLHLRVPPLDPTSNNELHKTWLSAFRQSSKLTLQSISILGGSTHTQGTDLDWDGPMPQRPFPKSPSLIARGDASSSPRRQEREEREWWSSCFHQVLREFQSRDAS